MCAEKNESLQLTMSVGVNLLQVTSQVLSFFIIRLTRILLYSTCVVRWINTEESKAVNKKMLSNEVVSPNKNIKPNHEVSGAVVRSIIYRVHVVPNIRELWLLRYKGCGYFISQCHNVLLYTLCVHEIIFYRHKILLRKINCCKDCYLNKLKKIFIDLNNAPLRLLCPWQRDLASSLFVVCCRMTCMTMPTFDMSGKSLKFVGRMFFQVNKRSRSRSLMIIIWEIEFEEQNNKYEGYYFNQSHHSCRGSNKDNLTQDNNIP